MIRIKLLFSVFLLSCALGTVEAEDSKTLSSARRSEHVKELKYLGKGDPLTDEAVEDLYSDLKPFLTDKHSADDIRNLLGYLNELRRKMAIGYRDANTYEVTWDEKLAERASKDWCYKKFMTWDRYGCLPHRLTNNFRAFYDEFGAGQKNMKYPFWIDHLTSPRTYAIGCAVRNCEQDGVKYELLCIIQSGKEPTIEGIPGSACQEGEGMTDGLCHRGSSSIWAAFSTFALTIAVYFWK